MTPIYLDNNATTPIDPAVNTAMRIALEEQFGNPASSTHPFGWYAEELVTKAREQVASLLNARPEEIVFTSGATESNNLAIKGTADRIARRSSSSGQYLSATTEHKAVLDPLFRIAERGANVQLLPVDGEGMISFETLAKKIRPETTLLSLMFANNEIGVIHDIKRVCQLCREHKVLMHCDATQAIGKCRIDVQDLGVDLLSLSAHKVYGPKGVGALFIKRGTSLIPQLDGGGHEDGYRSGTLNVPGIIGLGVACELAQTHLERDAEHMNTLAGLLFERLNGELEGVHLVGSKENRIPGNLNMRFDGVDNAILVGKVNSKLALSVSSACQSASATPSHVLSALGLSEQQQREAVRIGIGRFTTKDEVQLAAEILSSAIQTIRSKQGKTS